MPERKTTNRIGRRPIDDGVGNRDKRVTQEFHEDEADRLTTLAAAKWDSSFAEHLRSCVDGPGVKRVLEFGCGVAAYVPSLSDSGIDYVGMDFTMGMLTKATRFHSEKGSTFFMQGDIEATPLQDGCMDLVFSYGVLGEYAPVDGAIMEAARLLRPGGILTFTFMNLLVPYRLWKTAKIAAVRLTFGVDSRAYHCVGGRMIARHPKTPAYVLSVAKRAGFRDTVLRNTRDERGHFLVTCVKP